MTEPRAFTPFAPADVAALVAGHPELLRAVGIGEVTAVEVGDGNLNQVFIATADEPERGVVVKQALPYLRVAGEGWPLTLERMRLETQSLLLYNTIVPSFAPVVYDHSHEQSWVAMEYLSRHRVMRQAVIDGSDLEGVGRDVGGFIAAVVYTTSEMSLDAPSKRALALEYSNPALCQMQEQFVYTNPFFLSPENVWNVALDADVHAVRSDSALKVAIADAKAEYMNCGEALLHGDLHSGSVMVSDGATGPATKIIDPEFAFYGPISYDIGTFLANLAIGVLAHEQLTGSPETRRNVQQRLINEMRATWSGFVEGIESRWTIDESGDLSSPGYWGNDQDGFERFRTQRLASIAARTGRHGGCEMLRRCMGIVSVAELDLLSDADDRASVERKVIEVARRWLLDPVDVTDDLAPTIDHLLQPLEAALGIGATNP